MFANFGLKNLQVANSLSYVSVGLSKLYLDLSRSILKLSNKICKLLFFKNPLVQLRSVAVSLGKDFGLKNYEWRVRCFISISVYPNSILINQDLSLSSPDKIQTWTGLIKYRYSKIFLPCRLGSD